MTQGKVWSQRYRTTYIDINNFADKTKSFSPPESKWNLYLIKVSLTWKKPILNFMSFRIIHIETEYGSDIGLLRKKKIPVGMIHLVVSYFSFFFFCIYTNLEGNKAMFISLEYLFLATKKNYKFQKAENMAFSEPYQSQSRKFFKLIFIEAKKSLVIWKFRNFHDSWIKIEILKKSYNA